MISTLYLIQFIALCLWQLTSQANKKQPAKSKFVSFLRNARRVRIAGATLISGTLVGFIVCMGLMSGICGFMIGLMGVGCLSVALTPFNYLRIPAIAGLYTLCVLLENLI